MQIFACDMCKTVLDAGARFWHFTLECDTLQELTKPDNESDRYESVDSVIKEIVDVCYRCRRRYILDLVDRLLSMHKSLA